MEREEILSLFASNPEAIEVYIKGLESQIKELSKRLQALEACLNQNIRNSRSKYSTVEIPIIPIKLLVLDFISQPRKPT